MKSLAAAVLLTACFQIPQPAAYQPADPAVIHDQQRAAFAKSAGFPTNHTPAELEAMIAEHTAKYHQVEKGTGTLEVPRPFTIEGTKGTCYKVVMRLRADARWERGAEAGLRFDFSSPSGNGSGGPGVRGPGAVASVGCAEASGPITLTMAPLIGNDPIGHGSFDYQLYARRLSTQEYNELQADKQRQIREQQDFARAEEAKRQNRANVGCAKCDGRYQGCIGAGRSESVCRSNYSTCTFEEVGADASSSCPFPSR